MPTHVAIIASPAYNFSLMKALEPHKTIKKNSCGPEIITYENMPKMTVKTAGGG